MHQQQGRDDGKVAHPVNQKAPAFSCGRDHHTGNCRSYQPRTIRHRGTEGDRVVKVFAVVDHLNEE